MGFLLKLIPSNWVFVLVAFLTGFGSSMYVTHVWTEKVAAGQLRDALQAKDEEMQNALMQLDLIRTSDALAYERIISNQTVQKQKTQIITKEIVKYVPQETDGRCNFTLGAVGVLNLARSQSGSTTVSEATGLSDAELGATSDHTPQAEIESHIQCADRYNELSAKHNTLIEWINSRDKQ